jgi:hypothetical protein
MNKFKRVFVTLACVFALIGAAFAVPMAVAQATDGNGNEPPCVPKDAWTEVIPAETHIEKVLVDPGSPAVPGVDEIWANFAPTKPKTFVGPPSWPSDDRGKWIVHDKIPGGHSGPDGVYSKGNPHKGGNWFYRLNGVDPIPEVPPTYEDKVIIDVPEKIIEHPAVTCPEEPPLDCDDPQYEPQGDECETEEPPTDTPTTETPEPEPETPVENDEPKFTTDSTCVGDALVTKTYKDGVAVSTDTKNGAARCAVGTVDGPEEAPREEGF